MISSRAAPRGDPFRRSRGRRDAALVPTSANPQSDRRGESKAVRRSPPTSLRRRARNLDLLVARSSPQKFNPQNTEDPLVGPSLSLTATEAVEVQLRALERDDEPWTGHGVQTAYLFCRDSGSMEMSRYFEGKSASLYHEDHFVSHFRNKFPDLLSAGATVVGVLDGGDERGNEPVAVEVTTAAKASGDDADADSSLVFYLERCAIGRRKGSWLVAAIHRRGKERE